MIWASWLSMWCCRDAFAGSWLVILLERKLPYNRLIFFFIQFNFCSNLHYFRMWLTWEKQIGSKEERRPDPRQSTRSTTMRRRKRSGQRLPTWPSLHLQGKVKTEDDHRWQGKSLVRIKDRMNPTGTMFQPRLSWKIIHILVSTLSIQFLWWTVLTEKW